MRRVRQRSLRRRTGAALRTTRPVTSAPHPPSFGKLDSANALYNRGNALALSGDFQGAIDSYNKSLEAEPNRQDAIDNRELVKSLLEQQQQEQQGNDQDSNSDQSDQEGESQDSESDSSQQEQDSSESQEGSSDPSDQQPSDQESQPSADGR